MEGIIRFSYVKFIDAKSTLAWEKAVFENSYLEYKSQVQHYPEFDKTVPFSFFLRDVPEAGKIHHHVSTAIHESISRLKGVVPQISDSNGALCLSFRQFKFEILDSHFDYKSKHSVKVEFIAEPMLCVGIMGDNFLISAAENLEKFRNRLEVTTQLLPFQDGLTVHSFQKIS